MISEEAISKITGVSRDMLRKFREVHAKKKGWFSEENGSVMWDSKPIQEWEVNAGLEKGEIEGKYKALGDFKTPAATKTTALVVRLCLNRRIVLGTVDGVDGVCRIRVPEHRRLKPGVKLYVTKINEDFFCYAGRVPE